MPCDMCHAWWQCIDIRVLNLFSSISSTFGASTYCHALALIDAHRNCGPGGVNPPCTPRGASVASDGIRFQCLFSPVHSFVITRGASGSIDPGRALRGSGSTGGQAFVRGETRFEFDPLCHKYTKIVQPPAGLLCRQLQGWRPRPRNSRDGCHLSRSV